MNIAWFSSSFIGSRSRFFTDQVMPLLKTRGYNIDLYNDQNIDPLTAFKKHRYKKYDLFFYQVEEGSHCHWIRTQLGAQPGVVLFHDPLLTDYGSDPISNSSWSETVRKYHDLDRPWASRSKEYKREGYVAVREMSLAIIPLFSTSRGIHEFRNLHTIGIGGENAYVIHEPILPDEYVSLSLPSDPIVIGLCGRPRIEDRIHKILQGIKDSEISYKIIWMLDAVDKQQALDILKEFSIVNFEIIEGRNPYKWHSLLPLINVPIHTRFSVFESTSPYLQLSMAAAKNCVVMNFGDDHELSDHIAFKIDPGACESRALKSYITSVANNPNLLINEFAREYAIEVHSPSVIASELDAVFKKESAYISAHMARWDMLMKEASQKILSMCSEYEHIWNRELYFGRSSLMRDLFMNETKYVDPTIGDK